MVQVESKILKITKTDTAFSIITTFLSFRARKHWKLH